MGRTPPFAWAVAVAAVSIWRRGRKRRLLLVTLEHDCGTFSGNGVYTASLARGLRELGHDVLVVCGAPGSEPAPPPEDRRIAVALPTWGTLDARCSWREFGERTPAAAADAVLAFRPDVVVCVDWSAVRAVTALLDALDAAGAAPGVAYLNCRAFSRHDPALREAEAAAQSIADASVALSASDSEFLHGLGGPLPAVVHCPLRADIAQLAQREHERDRYDGSLSSRPYITCVVRLVPEKEPERFVSLIQGMKARGALRKHRLTPVLVAGDGVQTFSTQELIDRLKTAVPDAVVVNKFLGPSRLAELFAKTRVNVHPPAYDAFGMTLVEAAAFGATPLIGKGASIGATAVIPVMSADLDAKDGGAREVDHLLEAQDVLASTSERARRAATSWNEKAHAKSFMRSIDPALDVHAGHVLPSAAEAEALRPHYDSTVSGIKTRTGWSFFGAERHTFESLSGDPGLPEGRFIVCITACNPMGRHVNAYLNRAANERLRAEIGRMSPKPEAVLPHVGVEGDRRAPLDGWYESGYAVVFPDKKAVVEKALEKMHEIGRYYRQAAVYVLHHKNGSWYIGTRACHPQLSQALNSDARIVAVQPSQLARHAASSWSKDVL